MSSFTVETRLNFTPIREFPATGQSIVSVCRDNQLNSIIAVKKVEKRSLGEQHLFFDECKKLYQGRHNNVLPVLYGCQDEGYIYTAMPYMKNGTLLPKIGATGMDVYNTIRYSLQFLAGVNHIHTKDLIHFDIKPENVLISDSDQAMIMDFGFAKYMKLEGLATIQGSTLQYVPPETWETEFQSLKFDIYQCGATIYHMLVGDNIFREEFNKHAKIGVVFDKDHYYDRLRRGKCLDRALLPAHIPSGLKSVIKRATERVVDDRYDSILSMMNDIARIKFLYNWSYSTDFVSNWKWEIEDKNVSLTKNADGTWNIECRTPVNRKVDYCKKNLNNSDKNTLLKKVLHKEW